MPPKNLFAKRFAKVLCGIAALSFFTSFFILDFAIGASKTRQGFVEWVIDGDTFDLKGGERIRLIGVNAPEYQLWKHRVDPYGKEASGYAKKLLHGKKVTIETDKKKKDKYGRTLAYVYLENGEFVNMQLVREGYAKARYYAPNGRYKEALKKAEKEAKKSKKGLWRNSPAS